MLHMQDREVRVVKGILILTLIVLAGCAGYTPLGQLEEEALLTGDWSAVEKRERLEVRRNLHSSMRCPPGTIAYCNRYSRADRYSRAERCSCANSKEIRSLFDSRY